MIVVTGSTGFLGVHVVPKLVRQYGKGQVVCLIPDAPTVKVAGSRTRESVLIKHYELLGARIVKYPAFGEVEQYRTVLDILGPVSGVVYMAANNNRASGNERLHRDNVETLERFMRALGPLNGVPFILTSSIMAEAADSLRPRFSNIDSLNPYGVSKREAEQVLFREAQRVHAIPIVLRLASVYGKTSKVGLVHSVQSLARLATLAIPKLDGRASVVHVDDAAEAIVASLQDPKAGTFYVDNGETLSVSDMVERYARIHTREARQIGLPTMVRRFFIACLEILARSGSPVFLDLIALFDDVYIARGESVWNHLRPKPRALFDEREPRTEKSPGIALIGASGFIGSSIARALLLRGYSVRCGVRANMLPFELTDGMSAHIQDVDLSQPESIEKFVEGARVVVYAAGLTTARGQRTEEEYMKENVTYVEHLVAALRSKNISRFIFLGSQAYPGTAYGKSKARAEEFVRESGLAYTTLKPALVVGERGLVATLLKLVKLFPILPVPLSAPRSTDLVDVETIAEAVCLAVSESGNDAIGKTYSLGSTEPVSLHEIMQSAARIKGVRRLFVPVPRALLTIGSWAGNLLFSNFPLNAEVIDTLYRPKPVQEDFVTPLLTEDVDAILRRHL